MIPPKAVHGHVFQAEWRRWLLHNNTEGDRRNGPLVSFVTSPKPPPVPFCVCVHPEAVSSTQEAKRTHFPSSRALEVLIWGGAEICGKKHARQNLVGGGGSSFQGAIESSKSPICLRLKTALIDVERSGSLAVKGVGCVSKLESALH